MQTKFLLVQKQPVLPFPLLSFLTGGLMCHSPGGFPFPKEKFYTRQEAGPWVERSLTNRALESDNVPNSTNLELTHTSLQRGLSDSLPRQCEKIPGPGHYSSSNCARLLPPSRKLPKNGDVSQATRFQCWPCHLIHSVTNPFPFCASVCPTLK